MKIFALVLLAAASTWGKPSLTADPLPLAEAVKTENLGKAVRVEGTAASVCQKKGCWLMLKGGDREVRVTFKDYGFFVPKDLAGQKLVVEGVVSETEISEKDAKHYAKDAGASKEEIAKIQGSKKDYAIVATAVSVAGDP
jgi:hypothetical protein